jgi:hypothetical protein
MVPAVCSVSDKTFFPQRRQSLVAVMERQAETKRAVAQRLRKLAEDISFAENRDLLLRRADALEAEAEALQKKAVSSSEGGEVQNI